MIYCVEDDNSIRELVVYTLQSTGFEAYGFGEGADMFAALAKAPEVPELILLDIMLPNEDGLSILKKIRANNKTSTVPVIMLTARGSEFDQIIGLDSGADDYITKPFGMMSLVSRIKAVLRRAKPASEVQMMKIGDLILNLEQHTVYANTERIDLTFKEFEMLHYLMKNEGIVLSRDKILETIWGYSFDGETRTVDVHIRTLRQKLGECGNLIDTIRGVGYRIGGK